MSDAPHQVDEAAELATQLHEKMFAPKVEDEQEEVEAPQEEVEEAVEDNTPPDETFKTKYDVLKGKYDSEVPRLHHELKELKQMVFERLGDAAKKVEQPEVKADLIAERLTKFKEEYGEEFVEMQRMFARMEAEELINKRVQPVQDQVSTVEETQIKAAQQNFVGYLNENVTGDWSGINEAFHALKENKQPSDQKAASFLMQREPTSGLTYQQIMAYHNDNWDADGLAAVFNTFLGSAAPPAAPVKVKQPNPAQQAIVAPSRTTHTTPPAQSDKRIWTEATMNEFYKADRMNKYSSDESTALWEDLTSALKEGRIR
jgi:hypothetical protein